jgi:hypothetical protein
MPADEFNPRSTDSGPPAVAFSVESCGRFLATCLGIVVIVIGLWAALKVFGALYDGLNSPEQSKQLFSQWAETVGGDKLTLEINAPQGQAAGKLSFAPFLAVMVIGGGTFMLCWLAMGIMLTGAKIVSWASGDREAVARIVRHALGRG